MTTSATPLISSACTALSSSAIMFGSVRRLATRLEAPEVASLEGIEPIASRLELTLGAQRPTSSCPCEATALLLASPGTPLQLSATTDPIAKSILVAPRASPRVWGGSYLADLAVTQESDSHVLPPQRTAAGSAASAQMQPSSSSSSSAAASAASSASSSGGT